MNGTTEADTYRYRPFITVVHNAENYYVPNGQIVISKYDADIHTPLKNAIYELRAAEDISDIYTKDELIETLTTDSDGKAFSTTPLPVGYKYYVIEKTAPSNYVIDTQKHEFSIVRGTEKVDVITVSKELTNKYQRCSVTIKKVDELTGAALAGAVYKLSAVNDVSVGGRIIYSAGEVIETLTTGSDGTITSTVPLYVGFRYRLTEITAPLNYIIDPMPNEFVIEYAGQNVQTVVKTAEYTNIYQTGKITVTKRDSITGATLANTTYAIRAKNDVIVGGRLVYSAGELIEEITTGSDGTATTTKPLYVGYTYTATEIIAPPNYVVESTPQDVTLTYAGQNAILSEQTAEQVDDYQKARLTIHKLSTSEQPLAGAVFCIKAKNDVYVGGRLMYSAGELIEEITTGADGKAATTKPMYVGYEYSYQETAAPSGYVLDNSVYSFAVDYAGQDISVVEIGQTLYNSEQTGSISVQKRTEGQLNIEGIGFTLKGTSESGRIIEGYSLTNSEGIAVFEEIPIGTYSVLEDGETVPYGYMVADEKQVTVFYSQTTTIEIFNGEKAGSIQIRKGTSTSRSSDISNIGFTLKGISDSGRAIEIYALTNSEGIAVFEEIPIGTYSVIEDGETVPYAYMVAEPKSVTVFNAETTTVDMYNYEKSGTVTVKKRTEGQLNIEGIGFTLKGTSESGRIIESYAVTDSNGTASVVGHSKSETWRFCL